MFGYNFDSELNVTEWSVTIINSCSIETECSVSLSRGGSDETVEAKFRSTLE